MHRSVLVDLFKALASQLIVLHHLCLYSPMTEWVAQAWPAFVDLLLEDGRLAVQPFLVIGGFLAAQTLHKRRDFPLLELTVQRYIRLAPPLGFALVLVILSTAIVGSALADRDWVSPMPSLSALLAHMLFLQDVLGVPSLTAGAWYAAIDLQLFMLFVTLMHAARKLPRSMADELVPALLAVATWASILVFSREPRLDMWAIYFLSAYGLGALAAWAAYSPSARYLWWATVALVLVDCWLEPRGRPLWALATALALYAGRGWFWGSRGASPGQAVQTFVRSLSAWSYGVFVGHFAVIMLFSGLWERFKFSGLSAALAAFALVLLACLGLGAWIQTQTERLVIAGNRRWHALTSPR